MANLPESSTFDAGVYQIETTDPVIGGASGVTNTPLKNLTNRTKYLKDHVDAIEAAYAPKASPAFTGTPTAPTPSAGTNTTQIATTAFVVAAISSSAILLNSTSATIAMDGSQSAGVSALAARADHVHPTDITRAPIASPAFTGTPTAPTAAQFDNSTSIATTAFVLRQGLQLAGVSYYTANTTLSASDIGKAVFVNFAASGGVITLPSAGSVLAGVVYTIYNWGANSFTLSAQTGELINNNNNNPQTFTMQPYSTITLIAEKSTTWTIIGGSGQLTTSPLFGASLAASGFQKLPSGLILQWGTTGSITTQGSLAVTLPIAFPTTNIGVTLNFVNDGGNVAESAGITAKSTTGFTLKLSGDNPDTVFWMAWGY